MSQTDPVRLTTCTIPAHGKVILATSRCFEALKRAAIEVATIAGQPLAVLRVGALIDNLSHIRLSKGHWYTSTTNPERKARKGEYALVPSLGRSMSLKDLDPCLAGIAYPVTVDKDRFDASLGEKAFDLCPYPLYYVDDRGCDVACPVGRSDCLGTHLTQITAVVEPPIKSETSPAVPHNRWRLSQNYKAEKLVEELKDALKKADLRECIYTPAIYVQGEFSLESWPSEYSVQWNKIDQAYDAHAKARMAAQASKKFRKENCDRCVADCYPWQRRRCAAVIDRDSIQKFAETGVASQSHWSRTTSWRNKAVQAGLCLSGETVHYTLPGEARPRRYRVGVVHKRLHTTMGPGAPRKWLKSDRTTLVPPVSTYGETCVRLVLDWGSYYEIDVPLAHLFKQCPELKAKMDSWVPVRLSKELMLIYMFLTSWEGFKHSPNGVSQPTIYISPTGLATQMGNANYWDATGLRVGVGKKWITPLHFEKLEHLHKPSNGLVLYWHMGLFMGWRKNF